ncbi:hypothetical protein AB205_0177740 [Aquarana catesbeiana]|uniref:Uncharacterized protein n=1 Tax=Aquarana catesbeiana TaxID=8400 RepID=A0A2G9Q635_AQUCT|nr:hypothetical protein AB205_0177740 [Aquarana catesbeiana]
MSYPMTSQPQAAQGYSASSGQWNSEVMDCCEDMGICTYSRFYNVLSPADSLIQRCGSAPLPGLCGAFIPCILACKVATQYGECCCLPFLGGTVMAMRTGMRERYHIPVRIRLKHKEHSLY